MWTVAQVPPQTLARLAGPVYAAALLLLVAVALGGEVVNGARRWLNETLAPAYEAAISGKENEQDPPATGLWRMLLFGTTQLDEKLPYAAAPPVARARLGLAPSGLTLTETNDGLLLNSGALGRRELP
jgi:hypothetical protein